MTIIFLKIWLLTSCCKNYNNHNLTEKQTQEIFALLPDAPKLENFTEEEKIKIASLPFLFKNWAYETIKVSKCVKYNKCD